MAIYEYVNLNYLLAFIALLGLVLFNPIYKIILKKSEWQLIDGWVAIAILLWIIFDAYRWASQTNGVNSISFHSKAYFTSFQNSSSATIRCLKNEIKSGQSFLLKILTLSMRCEMLQMVFPYSSFPNSCQSHVSPSLSRKMFLNSLNCSKYNSWMPGSGRVTSIAIVALRLSAYILK